MRSQLHPTGMGHFEVVQQQVSDLGRKVFTQAPSQEEVYPRDIGRQWFPLGRLSGHWRRVRLPLALPPTQKGSGHGRPLMRLSWDWSGCCARFNDLQHTSPVTLRVTTSTIEMMAWQTKTASAFRIKKNPVPLIAPKLTMFGADWWTDWVETLKSLHSLERFQDMDYLIPTLSKDFQGVIPRPGSSDRSLRWLKEALIRQGVDQDLVQPLSWHSFRVFIPDCAYQLGIPTESTADIYTREKRNVVVDIWGKVVSRMRDINMDRGKEVYGKIFPMKTGMTSLVLLTMGAP